MDSKEESKADGGHKAAAGVENSDSSVFQKKRARRVSFAELTSVHFFDRDEEDNENPSTGAGKVSGDTEGLLESGELIGGNKEFGGEGDAGDSDDDEELEMRRSFLRPVGSPSPGGSTFGSASSNDDEFFGPVSANFIRLGRFSDSGASADNPDVTMDSATFSMHFRSLITSDSGVDLKTPMGSQIFSEEKTPKDRDAGSPMAITLGEKPNLKSSIHSTEASGSQNSNAMSLVGETLNKYDYEKLSPRLDALLAESRKNLFSVSASDDIATSMPTRTNQNKFLPLVHNGDKPSFHSEFHEENATHENSLQQPSSGTPEVTTSKRENYQSNNTPYKLSKNESETRFMSSRSPVKRPQIEIDLTAGTPSEKLAIASPNPSFSLLRSRNFEGQDIQTSIQRSISKLESLEKSAFSSVFARKVDSSSIKSLNFLRSPSFDSFWEKKHHSSSVNKHSFVEDKLAGVLLSEENRNGSNKEHLRAKTQDHFGGRRNLFSSNRSNEDALMTETESLLAEQASGDDGGANLLHKYVSSPISKLEKRLSASPGHQSKKSEFIQLQMYEFDKGLDSTPEKNPLDVDPLIASGNINSVTCGMNIELETEETDNQEGREALKAIGNISTPKENKSHSTFQNVGNQTTWDVSMLENNPPGGELVVTSQSSITPSFSTLLDESRLHKNQVVIPTTSPSRKGLGNIHPSRIPLPKSIHTNGGLENFSSNKRSVELLLRDSNRSEMTILKRSPKIQKSGSWDPQAPAYPDEVSATVVVGYERKKWNDTYSKFSEDMKGVICGSASMLNSKMIDVLQDMLVNQQRRKKYEMFHLGVMPQGKIVLQDLQLEKMAEINSLLHQVVFQRAKLQLQHIKRERLSKQSQLLSSRIQESEILRAQFLETCALKPKFAGADDLSLSVMKKGEVVCEEKLTAMRQELEALNKKILNLTRTFQSCCKMKAEPSTGRTIALVNEHLEQRASCRFIRLDMQMWSVQSVGCSNGQHNIILNYLEFITQSITIIVGPTSRVSITFKLIETNILKRFPNMGACVAFAFVFSTQTACKYAGTKTLARETQVTSSILGTLLDVLEELQVAQIESHSLTESSFCSPSVGRLDLILYFFNFNSGKKLVLTLDMSCLKRGIYPSDILPLEVATTADSEKCSVPIFDAKIGAAIKNVRTGHMRIVRLCQCVSQLTQASSL
ncbi:uncharacterized protein LOC127255733 isoform X2 [Andrographis paniculata]|uniref:uncharacterized protein LOC127255733 isoform X2 n=1 Tax=Andrographis paniculata TaxID=175694 RepID=UPI0021E78448|nr:uncharacterized protein LOC127255733 isoform X2 [Andrographis paniculata]